MKDTWFEESLPIQESILKVSLKVEFNETVSMKEIMSQNEKPVFKLKNAEIFADYSYQKIRQITHTKTPMNSFSSLHDLQNKFFVHELLRSLLEENSLSFLLVINWQLTNMLVMYTKEQLTSQINTVLINRMENVKLKVQSSMAHHNCSPIVISKHKNE